MARHSVTVWTAWAYIALVLGAPLAALGQQASSGGSQQMSGGGQQQQQAAGQQQSSMGGNWQQQAAQDADVLNFALQQVC